MFQKLALVGLISTSTFMTGCLFDSNKKPETPSSSSSSSPSSSSSAGVPYDTAAIAKVLDKTDTAMFTSLKKVLGVFKNSDKIWESKYRLDKTPLLMVRSDKDRKFMRGLLLNHPDPKAVDPNAIELNILGEGMPKVYLIQTPIQSLKDNFKNVQWFDFLGDVAGTKTMRMRYFSKADNAQFSPEDSVMWNNTLIHEGFHRFQLEGNFSNLIEHPMIAPIVDSASVAYTLLEEEIMRKALSAPEADLMKHIKRLVAVRTLRNAMMNNPKFEEYANGQERLEGTARYIEHIFDSLVVGSTGPINWTATNWNKKVHLRNAAERSTIPAGISVEYVQGRYYATGSVLGLLLDRLLVKDWKAQVSASASPFELLKKQANLNPQDIPTLVQEAEADPLYELNKIRSMTPMLLKAIDEELKSNSGGGNGSSGQQASMYPTNITLTPVDALHTPKYLPAEASILGMSVSPISDYIEPLRPLFSPQNKDVYLIKVATKDTDTLMITQSDFSGTFEEWKTGLNMFRGQETYETYSGQSILYLQDPDGTGGLTATLKNGRVITLNSKNQIQSELFKILEGAW